MAEQRCVARILSGIATTVQNPRFSKRGEFNNTPQSQRRGRNLSAQERDKMFDRLATLVIEVREQVNSLQSRVSKLESRAK